MLSSHYLFFLFLQGSAFLATLLQRRVAGLDEYGDRAKKSRDLVGEGERFGRVYEKNLRKYLEHTF